MKGATDRQYAFRSWVIALIYLVGVALCLVPTMWVLEWYGLAVPVIVAWCAVAAYTVYRSRKRAVLGITPGFPGGLLIVMLAQVAAWVPLQMVP